MHAKSLSSVWFFVTPWIVAFQVTLSMGILPMDKNTGVGSHYLLQGIFPTQASNPGPPHCRWILYHLSHQGSLDGKVASLPQLVWGWLWFVSSSKHSCDAGWPYIGRGDNLTSLFIHIRVDPIYQNITWYSLNRNSFLVCQLYLKKAGGKYK